MKKNVASQVVGAEIITASDGSAFTGSVTCYVTGDGGTQAVGSVGSGACTHEGNGFHTYAPSQAETNYNHIAFTFIGTGAIPVTVQVYTTFPIESADSGSTQIARVGADGDTLESLSDQLDGIVSQIVTGVPQNEVATSATVTTGTVGSGTYTDTETDNGTYYQINPATADGNGNGIDVYLEYQIGTRFPNSVTINGKFNATGNRYTEVYAYNWSTASWNKISDINTRMNSSSSDENYAYPLTAKHRNGAGSNGEVRIRFTSTETNATYDLDLDQVLVQSVQAAASAAEIAEAVRQRQIENTYRDGVTIDTVNGTAGTDIGDHGIPQRPVDNLSDAYTIATDSRLGFNTFYMTSGSSVTLDASDYTNWVFKGSPSLWTVALGGRTLTGTAISSARVSGEMVNTGNRARFYECVCFATTLGNCVWYDSALTANTITAQDGASLSFRDCETASNQATATIDFDSPTSATAVDFLDFHGILEFQNMNANSQATILGVCDLTINANCAAGTILVGADVKVTNNGSVTVSRIHTQANVAQVAESTVSGVDDFKATGFSTHSAADVWSAATRTLTAFSFDVALATSQPNYAPAKAGDQMDLVDAPNATAVSAIQSGLSTLTAAGVRTAVGLASANLDTQLGDIPTLSELQSEFTTIKGASWSSTTDTLEALRDRGDSAWTTATSVTVSDKTGFSLASDGLDLVTTWSVDVTGDITGNLSGSVGSVTTKTGYKLASDGLDSISITRPTGVASTFVQAVMLIYYRLFGKSTLTSSELKTYAADGTTVVTTQAVSDDATTQTQGEAS